MCSDPSLGSSSSDSEREPEEVDGAENRALDDSEDTGTNSSTDSSRHEEEDTGAVSKSEGKCSADYNLGVYHPCSAYQFSKMLGFFCW